MTKQREIPADVYDTLELSALAFGGIGAYHLKGDDGCPVCYVGHLVFAGVIPVATDKLWNKHFGLAAKDNDDAVTKIAGDVLYPDGADQPRISFKQWCKALNVVRGR